ncbi:MAG: hypothetical protein DRP45_01380 [Candidatus Zixiibacteriota bacterium]|nr:MAG: hypothetical protein DRP45_01380 [candidate division Zixibacteria bacterium]
MEYKKVTALVRSHSKGLVDTPCVRQMSMLKLQCCQVSLPGSRGNPEGRQAETPDATACGRFINRPLAVGHQSSTMVKHAISP